MSGPNRPFGNRVDKIILTYKVTYKCRFCGHEWDDFVEKSYQSDDRARVK